MDSTQIWGDVATWVTGVATIALFIVALIQIRNERLARIAMEKELTVSKTHDQANRISCWLVKVSKDKFGEWFWVSVSNQSTQPIYNVVVSAVGLRQTGENIDIPAPHRVSIDIVPPGQGYIPIQALQFGHPGHSRVGIEIGFTDILGVTWIRQANGELKMIKTSALEFYDIVLPANWQSLENELPKK